MQIDKSPDKTVAAQQHGGLVAELLAIDEAAMYERPATTRATIERAATALAEKDARIAELERMLFPYAAAKEIPGYSTNGIYLIGDRKSVDAAKKASHYSAQIEEYRSEFKSRTEALEAQLTASRAECEGLRAALDLDAAIERAAITWCGEKDREISLDDIRYFKGNWSALPDLTAYVDRELGRCARAALSQKETGHAA